MKRVFYLLLACVLVTGCTFGVVTKNNPSNLKLGMSKQEVIKEMGKPHSVTASGNTEVLLYRVAHSKAMPILAAWDTYDLYFEDGRLVKYGPK